jgi:hypothetical protein
MCALKVLTLIERRSDMERLKATYNPCDECRYSYSKQNQESNHCKVCEFKTYIDAERQGLIIVLPCKVGETVYCFTPFCEICEETLDNEFSCEDCNKGSFVSENKFDYEMIRMFGRSIFLTKEEAEQALAK